MTAIHLNMMKLEGNGERGTEEDKALWFSRLHDLSPSTRSY